MTCRIWIPILALAVSLSLAAAGCDEEPMETDAGEPDSDAGPRADAGGRADAGPFDAGPPDSDAGPSDAGASDSGMADGGAPVAQSRITAVLAPTPLTLAAVDETGAPLVIDAAHAFDHDTTAGETFFISSGSDRLELTGATATTVTFGGRVGWVDGSGAMLTPDLLFAGALGASAEFLVAMFGADARAYDFTTTSFGVAAPLTETPGGGAFDPISATTVDLGSGAMIIALKAGSPLLHVLNGTSFGAFPTAPVVCGSGAAINASLIVGAEIAGLSPPGGADSVILIEGSNAHVLESVSPVCFSTPVALTDAAGAPVTPEIAFGIDYDGNGTDDLILIDRVTP